MTPLRQRMLDDMRIRNLAAATQRAYVEHVGQFARHFGRSPAMLGPEEIRAYQVYLAKDKQLAPATLGVAVAALRFLFRTRGSRPGPDRLHRRQHPRHLRPLVCRRARRARQTPRRR
jgi:Phage integrase, N-terminal SAM-like domain